MGDIVDINGEASCDRFGAERAQLVVVDSQSSYGAAFADVYDEWYGDSDSIDDVVSLLSERNPRRVLELGVGTGRIALPLAARLLTRGEIRYSGIDESAEMLQRLRTKDERGLVECVVGDMVDDQPSEKFDLVFVSYNTLFNLDDRDRQRRCIAYAAQRLAADGLLIIDACVIDENAPTKGSTIDRRGSWTLHTSSSFDVRSGLLTGEIDSRHDDGRRVARPFRVTYSRPAMVDEMCTSAGLTLDRRFGSWQRDPFDEDSPRHVSIYRLVR